MNRKCSGRDCLARTRTIRTRGFRFAVQFIRTTRSAALIIRLGIERPPCLVHLLLNRATPPEHTNYTGAQHHFNSSLGNPADTELLFSVKSPEQNKFFPKARSVRMKACSQEVSRKHLEAHEFKFRRAPLNLIKS